MADSKLAVKNVRRKSQTVQNRCWWIDDSIDTEELRRKMMDLCQALNVEKKHSKMIDMKLT